MSSEMMAGIIGMANLGVMVLTVGIAVGTIKSKLANLEEKFHTIVESMATNDKMDNVITRLEGLDGLLSERVESLRVQVDKLEEEISSLRTSINRS